MHKHLLLLSLMLSLGWMGSVPSVAQAENPEKGAQIATPSVQEPAGMAEARKKMVEEQIRARGVQDARVLQAMSEVPRHRFVLPQDMADAYADYPLPIGFGQTISKPHIVAYMCEVAQIKPESRVLEVGTGSGYHAAVLSRLAAHVHSLEIIPALAERTGRLFTELGYTNITSRAGDGYYGWADAGPFDAIVVTAAADHIPPALLNQLAEGGKMVIPVGQPFLTQTLVLVEKRQGKIHSRDLLPVHFVPFTGAR